MDDIGFYPDRGFRSLGKLILLAAFIGVIAGMGSAALAYLTHVVSYFALDMGAGFRPAGPAGESHPFHETDSYFQPWMILPIITLGAMVSAWIVYKFAPDAQGHGTDAAIESYHHKRGVIAVRVSLVKMISSAITLGTGGSGGNEGPAGQIGAGFGSFVATKLKLSDAERRSMLAAGLGAGIGAIFHAPLAGAMFAVEVLYSEPDFEAENLIPSFIASTISYSVFMLFFPHEAFKPLFAVPEALRIGGDTAIHHMFILLLPLAALALCMAAGSFIYVKTFYAIHNAFNRMKISPIIRTMIGAFLTGVLALILYYSVGFIWPERQNDALSVLTFGYGFLQSVLDGTLFAESTYAPIAAILLIVAVGKTLTTSLTIGSGGSAGVFGPSMVIGGCLGGFVGWTFHAIMPGVVNANDVVIFAILGMAAFFAAAANTPVSTLLMVSEMCSSYVLLLPSMWVCALAYVVSRRWSLYIEQVPSRMESPAHRGDFIVDVLQGMTVQSAMRLANKDFITVSIDTSLGDMSHLLTDTRQTSFPVLDHDNNYYGVFSLNDIRQFLYDSPVADLAVAEDLAATEQPLRLQMDLSSAISRFTDGAFAELPVVDEADPTKIVGMLRRQDLIATYSARLLEMRKGG